MKRTNLKGWRQVDDGKPYPGTIIDIIYRGKTLICVAAETTVYNAARNLILRYDQFEIWKSKEETSES